MKLPKIFYSKLFLGAVVIVLLGVFALELQQWQQRRKINAEISHLKEDQASLEQRNNALQQSLQYFSSSDYQEKLAREQLGLKKDGEIVINFPPNGIAAGQADENAKPASNPQKWWQYLFKKS
ncbi:MAG TPA: septum formation initiator family protein [Patescibacteria group bacterium]|jgi:cell division protein DivIC|nr:septum formation initiator family protein [Patescibacteria group bacterium]